MPEVSMAGKGSSAALGNGVVHLVSQKKGGVSKSVVASWVAQYLRHTGKQVTCFDTDPSNQTFYRVKALDVIPVQLIEDGEIRPALFDQMIEAILDVKGHSVVDTGSSGFYALWNYVDQNNLIDLLHQERISVVVHVPIAPRPDFDDTVNGFAQIADLVPDKSVIVWLNQRQAKAGVDVEAFVDLPVVRARESKILKVVVAVRQRYELHREAVANMLLASQTFEEAISSSHLVVKSRLHQVREEVFRELASAGM